MAHQGLNIKLYFQYMENLARMHVEIAHEAPNKRFTRMFLDEFLQAAQLSLDGTGPCLLVEPYEGRPIDHKSSNIMHERMLAYVVAMKVPQRGDYTTAMDNLQTCERIALEILARLRRDRLNYADQKFADVKLEEAEDHGIPAAVNGAWVGWRVMVPVRNVSRDLVYNAGQWNDDLSAPTTPPDPPATLCPPVRVCTSGIHLYDVPMWDGTGWSYGNVNAARDFTSNAGHETIDRGGGNIIYIPFLTSLP